MFDGRGLVCGVSTFGAIGQRRGRSARPWLPTRRTVRERAGEWDRRAGERTGFEPGIRRLALQNNRPPFGTALSGPINTTAPSGSGKPKVSTSDMNLPIWRGGKLTTAATCRPTSSSGR